MAILMVLASFPNSRIKPRPATTQSDTEILTVTAGPGVTQVLLPNPNRTTALIRNLDSTVSLYYGYDNSVDDQVGADGGMLLSPLQSVNIENPGALYIFNPSGSAVNVAIDEGEG